MTSPSTIEWLRQSLLDPTPERLEARARAANNLAARIRAHEALDLIRVVGGRSPRGKDFLRKIHDALRKADSDTERELGGFEVTCFATACSHSLLEREGAASRALAMAANALSVSQRSSPLQLKSLLRLNHRGTFATMGIVERTDTASLDEARGRYQAAVQASEPTALNEASRAYIDFLETRDRTLSGPSGALSERARVWNGVGATLAWLALGENHEGRTYESLSTAEIVADAPFALSAIGCAASDYLPVEQILATALGSRWDEVVSMDQIRPAMSDRWARLARPLVHGNDNADLALLSQCLFGAVPKEAINQGAAGAIATTLFREQAILRMAKSQEATR